ncbi:MAG TPA: TolC family protein, partial [Gemmatimonadales bacterium]|nr:TolC family protein [Gemmatimonadales bacterium]
MRWTIGLVGLLIAGQAAAQQPGDSLPTVTLDDAVQRALQVQPAMVQAIGNRRNAHMGRLTAWGAFIPSLSASGSYNNSTQPGQVVGSQVVGKTSYSAGLSANVDLFTGFRRIAGLSASGSQEDVANAG